MSTLAVLEKKRPSGEFFTYWSLVTVLSILFTGYTVCGDNQSLHISLIDHLNKPALYPGDPFIQTLKHYSAPVWHLIALFERYLLLEKIFLILFLLERFLMIGASGYLSKCIAPASRLAPIGAMIFTAFALKPTLGAGTIIVPYFEQTGFSIIFFLLAAAAFYRRSPYAWALSMAAGFYLNCMYGIYAATYFTASFLFLREYRVSWRKWLLPSAMAIVLMIPVLMMTFLAFKTSEQNVDEWITALQFFYPYHFYPEMWGLRNFAMAGTLACLSAAVFYSVRGSMPTLWRLNKVWLVVGILWIVYAFVAVHVAVIPAMIVMHPARASDIWNCLAGVSLVSVLACRVERQPTAAGVALFYASVWIWRVYFENHIWIFMVFFAGTLILNGFCFRLFSKDPVKIISFFLVIWAVLLSLAALNARYQSSASIKGALVADRLSDQRMIARWVERQTPQEAVFLVNPTWEYFRVLSKRPVYVLWKDGSAVLWDKSFAREWLERLRLIGVDTGRTKPIRTLEQTKNELWRAYNELSDKDVLSLSKRYSLDYWVVPSVKASGFEEVFRAGDHKVLRIHTFDKKGDAA